MKSMWQASRGSFLAVLCRWSASLVTQLITLVLRRFIALHSNCTNAPDSQTTFMATLLRQQGGCPVIRDGIPARSKGCARQGRAMAKRSNHKLQPLSLRLWPFWLSYMNANALWLAPINTVITTANMASQAKRDCCWKKRCQTQSLGWHTPDSDMARLHWTQNARAKLLNFLAAVIVLDQYGFVFWSRETWIGYSIKKIAQQQCVFVVIGNTTKQ